MNKYLRNGTSEMELDLNIGSNNGSEKSWKKNTANFGKLIKAVYASYVLVYIFCTS
jgi:hypothetical protein